MQMDSPRTRLLELSEARRISLASLSAMLGRNSSYLQQYLRKGSPRKLEEDDRRTLARFFGVDEGELGGPIKDKSFYPAQLPRKQPDHYAVPRLTIGASAGGGAVAADEAAAGTLAFSRRFIQQQGLDPEMVNIIRVEGDSMEPVLRNGDEILVDRRPSRLSDGIHVLRIDDALIVKRIALLPGGRINVSSSNPAYAPFERSLDEVDVLGRVVWKGGLV